MPFFSRIHRSNIEYSTVYSFPEWKIDWKNLDLHLYVKVKEL